VPDLEKTDQQRAATAQVTTRGILQQYWRTFLTLGLGVVLLSAIRQTRQVVIPLWAAHIGLSATANGILSPILAVPEPHREGDIRARNAQLAAHQDANRSRQSGSPSGPCVSTRASAQCAAQSGWVPSASVNPYSRYRPQVARAWPVLAITSGSAASAATARPR
jgi:hypothetical protein